MLDQLTTSPVFGDSRLPARFWAKVRIGKPPVQRPELGPCWEWTAHKRDGYGRFGMGSRTDGSATMARAHRVAYQTLVGPLPEALEPDHLCRNRPCVNVSHLEAVTRSVNLQRSPLMGRDTKGEKHGCAKLKESDIRAIRALRGRITVRALGLRYGVSFATISRIQRGRGWVHVAAAAPDPPVMVRR